MHERCCCDGERGGGVGRDNAAKDADGAGRQEDGGVFLTWEGERGERCP